MKVTFFVPATSDPGSDQIDYSSDILFHFPMGRPLTYYILPHTAVSTLLSFFDVIFCVNSGSYHQGRPSLRTVGYCLVMTCVPAVFPGVTECPSCRTPRESRVVLIMSPGTSYLRSLSAVSEFRIPSTAVYLSLQCERPSQCATLSQALGSSFKLRMMTHRHHKF